MSGSYSYCKMKIKIESLVKKVANEEFCVFEGKSTRENGVELKWSTPWNSLLQERRKGESEAPRGCCGFVFNPKI